MERVMPTDSAAAILTEVGEQGVTAAAMVVAMALAVAAAMVAVAVAEPATPVREMGNLR